MKEHPFGVGGSETGQAGGNEVANVKFKLIYFLFLLLLIGVVSQQGSKKVGPHYPVYTRRGWPVGHVSNPEALRI